MSDELNEETGGLSRRSMIKRGALVGGTLVWAQPVVQGFGTAAGAQTGEGSPLSGFSYIAVVFSCGGTTYYAKYELDEGTWEEDPGVGEDQCEGVLNTSGTTGIGGSDAEALLGTPSQTGDVVTITLTGACTNGSFTGGVLKQGQDPCANGTPSGDSITFTGVQADD